MFYAPVDIVDVNFGLSQRRSDFGQLSEAIKQIQNQDFTVDHVKAARLENFLTGLGIAGEEAHDPLLEAINQRKGLDVNRMRAQQLTDRGELARLVCKRDRDLLFDMDFHSVGLRP